MFFSEVKYFVSSPAFRLSLLVAAGCSASDRAAPQGFLEGRLHIYSAKPVELADGNPPTVTAETYAEYPLVLPRRTEKKSQVTADGNGHYRVALPPGTIFWMCKTAYGSMSAPCPGRSRWSRIRPSGSIWTWTPAFAKVLETQLLPKFLHVVFESCDAHRALGPTSRSAIRSRDCEVPGFCEIILARRFSSAPFRRRLSSLEFQSVTQETR